MLDADTTVRIPHGTTRTRRGGKKHVEVHDPRVSVSMKTHGVELVLFFDDYRKDATARGPVSEVRILPDREALEPHVLRRLLPQIPLYAQYARAAVQMNRGEAVAALRSLREVGSTRRGLGDEFFRIVGRQYQALVASGEQHPVKALGELHHATISSASRWIKEARRRGCIG